MLKTPNNFKRQLLFSAKVINDPNQQYYLYLFSHLGLDLDWSKVKDLETWKILSDEVTLGINANFTGSVNNRHCIFCQKSEVERRFDSSYVFYNLLSERMHIESALKKLICIFNFLTINLNLKTRERKDLLNSKTKNMLTFIQEILHEKG